MEVGTVMPRLLEGWNPPDILLLRGVVVRLGSTKLMLEPDMSVVKPSRPPLLPSSKGVGEGEENMEAELWVRVSCWPVKDEVLGKPDNQLGRLLPLPACCIPLSSIPYLFIDNIIKSWITYLKQLYNACGQKKL